ncbi:anti-sigma factor domain-containing protein [Pseudonocardia sp. DLS-67]
MAFALHALEPGEEATLRDHLAGCPSCQATVADTEGATAALGASVEQVDPPATLRENILTRAAQTPQVDSGSTPDPAGATAPGVGHRDRAGQDRAGARSTPTGPAGSATGPGRTGGSGPRRSPAGSEPDARIGRSGPGRRRRRIVTAALALVAVIAVAGAGGLAAYAVRLQQQRDAEVAQTRALVDVVIQLDRPGTSHATLSTSDGRPVAAVVTTTSERMVMTAGLSPNDGTSSVYVLWGVSTDAAPLPIGTFDVDPDGPGPSVRELGSPDPGPRSFLGYAISLEPGRVAPPAPTTVVASGQV